MDSSMGPREAGREAGSVAKADSSQHWSRGLDLTSEAWVLAVVPAGKNLGGN